MKRKFEEIIDYIEDLQAQNQLKQGERLPSIRSMAEKFACTKTTVIRAYKELESNHKIYSIPKGGYYVLEKMNEVRVSQGAIDFTEVMPDTTLLPYREFTHCMNRAVEQYKDHLFTYCDPQGLLSLRKALIGHFADQQIFACEEDIYITSGSQQALSILAKMPFPNGKRTILVEQPTYSLIQKTAELTGEKTIGITRDFNGIHLDELERIFKNEEVKFFYTMPRFHNPLGTSFSEKDKKRIVALAEKYDVYIVEDDYLVDLDRQTNVLPAHFYDISGKVIYVKSFSKAFMPGIRLGAVVMNKALHREFLIHKKCADVNTSVLAQGALELFINSGMYKKQIRKARLEYGKKMTCLRECVTHLKTTAIEFAVPDMGFFVWIRLNEKIDRAALIRRLKERNVYIASPEKNYIGQAWDENSYGICIAKLSTKQIRAGIAMICEEAEVLSL
ncbi:PLP-dependent aminotransferase family protein [Brevibacillus fluminis]|uniref:PLP-dependent aminotransferase family protein n=1 Tax=Brevibacillus fluminis TaxID=511487 RepID=A0A3M8CS60_9BACL|nr:PLP-dependent aminotransferase family protein [Brevibacillus fluminis]RNB78534.1 PLP-dependent aminotransferase family protein [Brevibacillus fluminis]